MYVKLEISSVRRKFILFEIVLLERKKVQLSTSKTNSKVVYFSVRSMK